MKIGTTIRSYRLQKNMSQGDIEKRTGLLRCYLSRVENGHTVPSVDTLERLARALQIPVYRIFTDDYNVKKPNIPAERRLSGAAWSKQGSELRTFAKYFLRMDDKDRGILFHMAS